MLSFTRRWQICLLYHMHPPFDNPPSFYHVSSSKKRHLPLLAISHSRCSLFLSPSLSVSLYVCLSLGTSFLSAFYSKSDRKAFIQPNLRDSGYIWFAWRREMLHLWMRWRVRQTVEKERERVIVLIWYELIAKWWEWIPINPTEVKKEGKRMNWWSIQTLWGWCK